MNAWIVPTGCDDVHTISVKHQRPKGCAIYLRLACAARLGATATKAAEEGGGRPDHKWCGDVERRSGASNVPLPLETQSVVNTITVTSYLTQLPVPVLTNTIIRTRTQHDQGGPGVAWEEL
jgi:hypothetical protein